MTAARLVIAVMALVAVLAGVGTAREIDLGRRAIADSDVAAAKGDVAGALARARDAAEAAAPGSPYVRQGYERLETIARTAEARADERTAVAAWGAMRSAATATSGPLVGAAPWLLAADDGLTRSGAPPLAPSSEVHASEAVLRASLAREDAPAPLTLTLLGVGALAFFAGCARLALTAVDLAALRRERIALLAAVAGAVLYAVACVRA